MKKVYLYLTLAVMAVLGTACSKSPVVDDPDAGEYMIGFGKVTVKADGDEPETEVDDKQMLITVFDFFSKEGEEESKYFDDDIKESESSTTEKPVWDFVKESHAWKVGAHEFISWVSTDENGVESGFDFNPTTKVLSLKETGLPGKDNIDYRYGVDNVVNWTKDKMDTPVEIQIKHLSSALTYTFKNESDKTYSIEKVTVGNNLMTEASATIEYGGIKNPTIVSKKTGSVELLAGEKTMVWPQTVEGAKLTVSFKEGESTTTKTAIVDVPNTTWEAGKVYNFAIEVVGKDIVLTLTVVPWDEENPKVIYGTGPAISAIALEYISGAAVTTGGGRRRNNYFANATDPIKGYFSVYAPVGLNWKIKVTGDTDLFTVESPQATPASGEGEDVDPNEIVGIIGGENEDNGRVEFIITKKNGATAQNSIKLSFLVVMSDGREISMNSEVTRSNGPLTITGQVKSN